MKKMILCLLLFVGVSGISTAKTTIAKENTNSTTLVTDNKEALQYADLILSSPHDLQNEKRMIAIRTLLKWMTDTPDFSFSIEPVVIEKIVGEDEGLLALYMACMAKYCLENEANSKDASVVQLNAVKLMIAYSEKPENKVKMSRSFKKIAEAAKKGELEKELNKA